MTTPGFVDRSTHYVQLGNGKTTGAGPAGICPGPLSGCGRVDCAGGRPHRPYRWEQRPAGGVRGHLAGGVLARRRVRPSCGTPPPSAEPAALRPRLLLARSCPSRARRCTRGSGEPGRGRDPLAGRGAWPTRTRSAPPAVRNRHGLTRGPGGGRLLGAANVESTSAFARLHDGLLGSTEVVSVVPSSQGGRPSGRCRLCPHSLTASSCACPPAEEK